MGGNALKEFGSKRLETERFNMLASKLNATLNDILDAHGIKERAQLIPSYREKEDHGDIDVVVPIKIRALLDNDQMMAEMSARFGVEKMEYINNGPVVSYGYPLEEGGVFQIDLIYMQEESLDFAVSYFAWNDVGNLMGRIAHKLGLRFGHDGLALPMRDETNLFATVTLTRDYQKATEFLGFSYERWKLGFNNLEEIFHFVTDCPRFSTAIYLLENRNHTARVRDKKRPTYTKFLAWLEAHPEADKAFEWSEDKSVWLPEILAAFPEAVGEYKQALVNLEKQKLIRSKYNGEVVSNVTGLSGKALGSFMADFKNSFESKEAFNDYMEQSDLDQIKAAVLKHHSK